MFNIKEFFGEFFGPAPVKVEAPVSTVKPAEVRNWARAQGIEVAERGRLSTEVKDAYTAAH